MDLRWREAYDVCTSDVTPDLANPPGAGAHAIFGVRRAHIEALAATAEATVVAEACLDAGVVPAASQLEALPVALSSISPADALASWNFKHVVQLRRIRGFHAVSALRSHPLIEIRSPREVIDDEEA